MEFTQEQKLFQQIVNEAWANAEFKAELVENPTQAIEKLTGQKLDIPEGKTLVVNDQTDRSMISLNIPPQPNLDELQLTEDELDKVSGGITISSFVCGAIAGGLLYDGLKWAITENNEEYGRRMFETGSPGGAK